MSNDQECYNKKCPKYGVRVKSGFPFTDLSWAFALSKEPIVRNRQAGIAPIKKINYITPIIDNECDNDNLSYTVNGETFCYKDLQDNNVSSTTVVKEVFIQP